MDDGEGFFVFDRRAKATCKTVGGHAVAVKVEVEELEPDEEGAGRGFLGPEGEACKEESEMDGAPSAPSDGGGGGEAAVSRVVGAWHRGAGPDGRAVVFYRVVRGGSDEWVPRETLSADEAVLADRFELGAWPSAEAMHVWQSGGGSRVVRRRRK